MEGRGSASPLSWFAGVVASSRRFGVPILASLLFLAACGADDGAQVLGRATRPLELTAAAATPNVQVDEASVPLEEIVFDTFDGGSIPLSEATTEEIERLFDAIAPIDAPDYESANQAGGWLESDDLVVGYLDPTGNAWAFPVRVLNSREIVNDELGGEPLVVTYCPLCGSGVVFSREAIGIDPDAPELLTFSNTSALFENDMVMVDRETGSYWWQVSGAGLVGPLTGAELRILPSNTTTFASWVEQHPDTAVMTRPDGRDYGPDSFGESYANALDAGRTPFPVSPEAFEDDRYAPSERVLVATVGDETRAWATAPARRVEELVGGVWLIVTLDGTGGSIITPDNEVIPTRNAYWFAVVASNPEVTIGL